MIRVVIGVILLPVVIDAGKLDKPHEDHKLHVGLKLFYGDLGPAGKLSGSHALQSELVTLFRYVCQESCCEEQGKKYLVGREGWEL